jgi:trans-aconitate methyltransferase
VSYHPYIFRDGKLVGDFEGMYAAEEREGFDSWHSSDSRHLRIKLALELIAEYNFSQILDIGCGKGNVTQFLKRKNNQVIGVDISKTAIAKARAAFPDIQFAVMPAADVIHCKDAGFDLITVQAVMAYMEDWSEFLKNAAGVTKYCLVTEYVPKGTVGCVKSIPDLIEEFSKHFAVLHKIVLDDEVAILFGKSR